VSGDRRTEKLFPFPNTYSSSR